jgi:hypothetical protein
MGLQADVVMNDFLCSAELSIFLRSFSQSDTRMTRVHGSDRTPCVSLSGLREYSKREWDEIERDCARGILRRLVIGIVQFSVKISAMKLAPKWRQSSLMSLQS